VSHLNLNVLRFVFASVVALVIVFCVREAHATVLMDAGPAPAVVAHDAGVASAPAAGAPASGALHDPITEPGAAWDDVQGAKKVGWGVAVFACLVMLARLAGRAKSIPWLAALGKGRTAVVVGGIGAVAVAAYDVAIQGGSWVSIAVASAVALAAYWNSQAAEA
jgi:hypothetical protein